MALPEVLCEAIRKAMEKIGWGQALMDLEIKNSLQENLLTLGL